jgi:tetratricopeptide (TPR) repeat protein
MTAVSTGMLAQAHFIQDSAQALNNVQEAEQRLMKAEESRRQGRTDAALSEFETLLASLQNEKRSAALQVQVLNEIGEIHAGRHDPSRAAAAFERSLALDPNQGVICYRLGLVYRESGDIRKAADRFQAALDHGFRNLGVQFNLAAAYFDSRQSASGVELADEIIGSSPKSPDLLLKLGRLLFTHVYYQEALAAFRLSHQQDQGNRETAFYLALTDVLVGQYPEAIQVLSAQPRFADPEWENLLAAGFAGNGDFDKAAEILKKTIANAPRSPHAYLNLALIRMEQAKNDDAAELLERFRLLGPQHDVKVFYSVKRNSCGALAAEIREAGEARLVPEKGAFYLNLAAQMADGYHYGSAVEILRLARPLEGSSPRLLKAAGLNCLNLAPQAPEAASLLRRVVAIDPADHEAWHLLGRALLRQGNTEEALAAFRRAVSLQPRAPYAVSLGKALLSTQSVPDADARREALAAFQTALTLEPANAIAHFEAGRLLSQSGEIDAARAHLLRAVELEPDFYEAYYVLGRLCLRAGENEQAQKYLALFKRTKSWVSRQSVISSGYLGEGRDN